ncbi:VWFA domain-containing protein [Trichostrongylus colubriformis]|uniref:VWFA domain-containing protein n=1 Tax=Trichostrongylus colubriformis TaxID=6319 RepID=A0AAN8IJK0_TRICO
MNLLIWPLYAALYDIGSTNQITGLNGRRAEFVNSSSAFLATSPVDGFINEADFRNTLNSRLTEKYSVGSLATEFSPPTASAVFSLRGSQSLNDVQNFIYGENRLSAVNITEGSKTLEVCNAFRPVPTTVTTKVYASWNTMATANPFATLFCQYSDAAPAPVAAARFNVVQAATDDNYKCQKLDIIVVFDTSQSVVEPFIRNYADFAVQFVSQYTLTGAVDGDNTRTGIISFSSNVKTVRDLAERSLDDFKSAVNGIHYTGGTTNTLAAMKAGRDMFKQAGGTTHGRTMVFLSDGQPYPLTDDTWAEIISVGSELKQMGVDIFFVGDGNGYNADTGRILSNITGNANWVFNTTADASVSLPADLLEEYPCPPLVCEMAYYAVELSEILSEEAKIQSLNFILQTAQNVFNAKNSTQFQLMVYNDQQ